jgi:predicted small metal-binding protein
MCGRLRVGKSFLHVCAEHAKTAHGIDNITPELAQKVKAVIKNE